MEKGRPCRNKPLHCANMVPTGTLETFLDGVFSSLMQLSWWALYTTSRLRRFWCQYFFVVWKCVSGQNTWCTLITWLLVLNLWRSFIARGCYHCDAWLSSVVSPSKDSACHHTSSSANIPRPKLFRFQSFLHDIYNPKCQLVSLSEFKNSDSATLHQLQCLKRL